LNKFIQSELGAEKNSLNDAKNGDERRNFLSKIESEIAHPSVGTDESSSNNGLIGRGG
jgi:hypothetical protein